MMKFNKNLLCLIFLLAYYPGLLKAQVKTDNERRINFFRNYRYGGDSPADSVYQKLERVVIRDNHLFEYSTWLEQQKVYSEKNVLGIGLVSHKGGILAETNAVNFSKTYASYHLANSEEVEIISMGVTPENKTLFEYRIVEDDKVETVKWQTIQKYEQKHGALKPYAVIGTFHAPGKKLLIEIRRKGNIGFCDGLMVSWKKSVPPQILWGTVIVQKTDSAADVSSIFNSTTITHPYVNNFDETSGLPTDLVIPAGLEAHEFYPGTASLSLGLTAHFDSPYEILLKSDTNRDTVLVDAAFVGQALIVPGKFLKYPGSYKLILKSKIDQQKLVFPFKVLPPPFLNKKASLKQILPYSIAALSGVALLFWIYRKSSERKLNKVKLGKERASQQLLSIRAQLNPHFIFNALSSVQNLMNKGEIERANHYLYKFSNLTRLVLYTAENELISLEDELSIMSDYLEMEQLRFGFQFDIKPNPEVNLANVEVPAMLLQPFVENAVKHGVATQGPDGLIEILVVKELQNLILMVKDNGHGFKTEKQEREGFGLNLSRDRMVLLNQLYTNQKMSFHIESASAGTTIGIKLENWIS
jgi:two-component system LytT family sensor kinase